MKKPLTAKEAAERLGVTDARVRQLCISGELSGAWKMGRDWLIPERAIKLYSVQKTSRKES